MILGEIQRSKNKKIKGYKNFTNGCDFLFIFFKNWKLHILFFLTPFSRIDEKRKFNYTLSGK